MRKLLVLAFVLAACGGKPSATPDTTPPGGGGRIAGPGQVVGDAALYAKVKASTLPLPAGTDAMRCEGEATLGAQIAAWEKSMAGPINARCEGQHCTIEIASPIDPSCDSNPDQDGCEGSAMIIEFDTDASGEIVVDTLMCMGAG